MKIRLNFVSNCSSSAFIVSNKDYKTSSDLAKAMLKIRDEEWSDYEGSTHDKISKEQLLIKSNKHNHSKNIYFPTTNYDTYIAQHDNKYVVYSSNNHDEDWSSIAKYEEIGEYFEDENYLRILFDKKYWFLNYDIEAKFVYDFRKYDMIYCHKDNHFEPLITLDGVNQLCPICDYKKIFTKPKIKHDIKLINI